MPRAEELALQREARRRHYGTKRTQRFVFGTLENEKKRRGGDSMAKGHRHRLFGFLFGKRSWRTRYNSAPNGDERSYRTKIGHRGKAGRLRAAKDKAREGRYEVGVYTKKAIRGGWGHGFAKTKTGRFKRGKGEGVPWKSSYQRSEAEKKEDARVAARRRYLAKHPYAKQRTHHGRASSRGFL